MNGHERPALGLRPIESESAVFLVHEDRPWFCASDAVGLAISRLLDGTRTHEQAAHELAGSQGLTLERANQSVESFLQSLSEKGLFEMPGKERPLQGLFLHLTERCNLTCRHCYVGSSPECHRALFPERVFALLGQWRELGGSSVAFSGGEPLLWEFLPEALSRATALGLRSQVLTNGTLIDPPWACRLLGAGATVQVSLDGADAVTHDALRGPGSFAAALAGLGALTGAGFSPERLTLACQLTPAVARDPEGMVRLAERIGAGTVRFLPTRPTGRGAKPAEDAPLGKAEFACYFESSTQVRRTWRGRVQVETGISGLGLDRIPSPWCPVGQQLNVGPDGGVYPCVLLMQPGWRLGDATRQGLGEILASTRARAAFAAVHGRSLRLPGCRRCEVRAFCQGGCAGLAAAGGSPLLRTDGHCALRRRWYQGSFVRLAARARRAWGEEGSAP